jgi:hypothetical protein
MSKQNINIDDLYRSHFEHFQKDPPDHVWEKIKKRLNQDPGAGNGKPPSKGGISGLTSLILIACFFLRILSSMHSGITFIVDPQ